MKVGLIGLGRIGCTFEKDSKREKPASHAGAISRHPNCQLVVGCDNDSQARETFLETFSAEVVSNISDLIAYDLDCISIATPKEAHCDNLALALESLANIVVIEKPIASNLKEALAMEKKILKSDKEIFVHHPRRFTNDYLALKEDIQSNRLGKVLSAHAKIGGPTSQSAEEVLLHDGTHMLDILRYLLFDGELVFSYASKTNQWGLENLMIVFAVEGKTIKGKNEKNVFSDQKKLIEDKTEPFYIPCMLEVDCKKNYFQFEIQLSFEKKQVYIGNGIYKVYDSVESPYYENFFSLQEVHHQNHYASDGLQQSKKGERSAAPVSFGDENKRKHKEMGDAQENNHINDGNRKTEEDAISRFSKNGLKAHKHVPKPLAKEHGIASVEEKNSVLTEKESPYFLNFYSHVYDFFSNRISINRSSFFDGLKVMLFIDEVKRYLR